jgi:hypothetical protein
MTTPDNFADFAAPHNENGVWVTAEKKLIPIADLSNDHLHNILLRMAKDADHYAGFGYANEADKWDVMFGFISRHPAWEHLRFEATRRKAWPRHPFFMPMIREESP